MYENFSINVTRLTCAKPIHSHKYVEVESVAPVPVRANHHALPTIYTTINVSNSSPYANKIRFTFIQKRSLQFTYYLSYHLICCADDDKRR